LSASTLTGGDLEFSQDDLRLHQDGNKTNRAGDDFELYQDNFQLDQDEITTETKATGGIKTKGRTGGDYEFGQDGFQLYQDESMTETKATGGIKTDARTGGNYVHGQNDFKTKATGRLKTDGRTDGDFQFSQDGFQPYQDEISTRGWRTAHAHDERKRANSGEFRQKQTNSNLPVFAHFLPIFRQKMGKNGQKKTGERNQTLAKQDETESFAEFLFGIATP
jgi:hypothetical protein